MAKLIFFLGGIIFISNSVHAMDPNQCSESKDFSCSFEQEDCPCWRQGQNGIEDDIDWQTGTQVALFGWNSIPRGRTDNSSTFAYAVRDGQHLLASIPKGAMLISKRLPCTDRPITVRLWYWKAAFIPQIRVCYKFFDKNAVTQCSAEVNGFQPPDWLPLTATLPPVKKEFQIVIQAIRLFGLQTAVAIDDISIEGDLTCTRNQNESELKKPDSKIEKINAVSTAVGKNSEKAKACANVKLAESWSGDYNRGVWQPCENGTHCKQQTGVGAATAWDVEGEGTYVLESQNFFMETKSILKFQYQFVDKTFTSKLRLCIDELDACPFIIRGSTQPQNEKWSDQLIPLSPGWHKIYFTVTNLKADHVKVRRINVQSDSAASTGECNLLMTLIEE